jgi:murein DD-endopeptidase MepM/ murein hydrolase activator NlpD
VKVFLILIFFAAQAEALEVSVTPAEPLPGDVLVVEVLGIDNASRASCVFRDKEYPLFAVEPGRLRAMIGITARHKPGWYKLTVQRKRFLFSKETRTLGVTIGKRKFSHQHIRMPKKKTQLSKKPRAKTALIEIRGALAKASSAQLWQGVFLRPAKGRRSSKYGHTRTINKKMSWSWHKGIDIAAKDGHPVLAPNGGRVALTGRYPVQGGTVIIDHGQGLHSAFLHLRSFAVKAGDFVSKGATIANVGGGGFSTGSHLHWGVYVHGAAVDPEILLKRAL